MGCQFALDDFGRGVSSFGYLEKLTVDMIKIDAGFIHNLDRDRSNHAIVLAIREVAAEFGLTLVAEGVENQAIRARVEGLGIEFMQGYDISEPTSLETWQEFCPT